MNDIQYIVFDFGGVLYDICWQDTLDLLNEHLKRNTINHEVNSSLIISDINIQNYEKGLISTREFRYNLCNDLKIKLEDEVFDRIWNATLTGLNQESVNMIKLINGKFPLALLSNTNELHYDLFEPECRELFYFFNHTFFSHQIGMRKPDTEIYIHVSQILGVPTNQILFIDDVLYNIIGAEKAGCRVFHYENEGSRTKLLEFINI